MNRCACIIAAVLFAGAQVEQGHEFFTGYIQHRVMVACGANHIDVTVQLTFFEEPAEHERVHIDSNGDGRISRAEIAAYLNEREPELARAVTLRVGSQAAKLIALRDPELDQLGENTVGRGHLRLTLCYFASTLSNLVSGAEMVIDDKLWQNVPALGSLQVEGKDGCRLEAVPARDPVFPPVRGNEARSFKARVLSPPSTSLKTPNVVSY